MVKTSSQLIQFTTIQDVISLSQIQHIQKYKGIIE